MVKKKNYIATSTTINPELKKFEGMAKHQEAFDALKIAVITAAVLGHPNFSKEFILETDASLNGLGTILLQQGKGGKICVITYTSHFYDHLKDLCATVAQPNWSCWQ